MMISDAPLCGKHAPLVRQMAHVCDACKAVAVGSNVDVARERWLQHSHACAKAHAALTVAPPVNGVERAQLVADLAAVWVDCYHQAASARTPAEWVERWLLNADTCRRATVAMVRC